MHRCPHCGEYTSDMLNRCQHCHEKIDGEHGPSDNFATAGHISQDEFESTRGRLTLMLCEFYDICPSEARMLLVKLDDMVRQFEV